MYAGTSYGGNKCVETYLCDIVMLGGCKYFNN